MVNGTSQTVATGGSPVVFFTSVLREQNAIQLERGPDVFGRRHLELLASSLPVARDAPPWSCQHPFDSIVGNSPKPPRIRPWLADRYGLVAFLAMAATHPRSRRPSSLQFASLTWLNDASRPGPGEGQLTRITTLRADIVIQPALRYDGGYGTCHCQLHREA